MQAHQWFARLLAQDCTAQERAAFAHWQGVPDHAAAFARCEQLWTHFGSQEAAVDQRLLALRQRVLMRTSATASEGEGGNPSEKAAVAADWGRVLAALPPKPRAKRANVPRRAWPWAMAACVCLLGMAGAARFINIRPPELLYATTSALREITLEDGSRLQLDVGTELSTRFDGKERSVTLRRGRALFDVAHDPGRPFTVELGQSRITVLGTRFQALRSPDDVNVVLDRGSLRLDGGTGAAVRSEHLVPGDQVGYSNKAPTVWRKRGVDSAAAMAWSRGRMVFRGASLADAVQEVNRYATPKLRIGDVSLAQLKISGNFIAGDSDLVASTWAATMPLRAEKQGEEIVLLPSRD